MCINFVDLVTVCVHVCMLGDSVQTPTAATLRRTIKKIRDRDTLSTTKTQLCVHRVMTRMPRQSHSINNKNTDVFPHYCDENVETSSTTKT